VVPYFARKTETNMELGAAPQRTAALEPLSLLNSAAPESLSGQSDGDSVGAIRGGAVEPLPSNEQEQEEVFPMGWGAEVRGLGKKWPGQRRVRERSGAEKKALTHALWIDRVGPSKIAVPALCLCTSRKTPRDP